jgi:hypothetical protein
MQFEFFAVPAERHLVEKLSVFSPTNPFTTWSFFQSKSQVECESWVLGLKDSSGDIATGCGAFLRPGRLSRTLDVPSLPNVGAESSFWDGVRDFCREHHVTTLAIGTFASPPAVEIPLFDSNCTRRNRCEFLLELTGDLSSMLRSNHKRNVKKGQKAGLVVRRTRTLEAAIIHRGLMNSSMDRRRLRGEEVGRIGLSPDHIAYLESGFGELFQAMHDHTVVSSVLVLHAAKGGYYQSAGTSPDGMATGASHFLINHIATSLSAEGREVFNLGGADEDSGLARFKEGFGASRVQLEAATFHLGNWWRRGLLSAIRRARSSGRLARQLIGQSSR